MESPGLQVAETPTCSWGTAGRRRMDDDVGVGAGPSERALDAGADGPGPAPTHRRRMSAGRKRDAVLRLLRREGRELASRGVGVAAAELRGWREAFLAAGEASMRSR